MEFLISSCYRIRYAKQERREHVENQSEERKSEIFIHILCCLPLNKVPIIYMIYTQSANTNTRTTLSSSSNDARYEKWTNFVSCFVIKSKTKPFESSRALLSMRKNQKTNCEIFLKDIHSIFCSNKKNKEMKFLLFLYSASYASDPKATPKTEA